MPCLTPRQPPPAPSPPLGEATAALDDAARFIARGTREFTLANVALFAAGFTTFALIYCVQPILPVLGRDFGVDAATASLALSATTQCLAVAMLVASSLSEVYGRKPVMVLSLFSSSALMIASAFAPGWRSLVALRALAGHGVQRPARHRHGLCGRGDGRRARSASPWGSTSAAPGSARSADG